MRGKEKYEINTLWLCILNRHFHLAGIIFETVICRVADSYTGSMRNIRAEPRTTKLVRVFSWQSTPWAARNKASDTTLSNKRSVQATTMKDEKKRKRKEEQKARKKQKREAEAAAAVVTPTDDKLDKDPANQDLSDKKKKMKKKKDKKKSKKKSKQEKVVVSPEEDDENTDSLSSSLSEQQQQKATSPSSPLKQIKLAQQKENEHKALTSKPSQLVESSAIEFYDEQIKQQTPNDESLPAQKNFAITLLLFYQYVEPVWDEKTYNFMLTRLQKVGKDLQLTGRMRVAKEGLNCTLTGSHESIVEYCRTLRTLRPTEFASTEFKLTSNLPQAQKFPNLKVFQVVELVHYGLEGKKAPPIAKFSGTHLEPKDYHQKLGESNTVIIDVRNHYEAAIGRFVPPSVAVDDGADAPKWLDPKMRKSTEFPAWLDRPEVKKEMKGKQVLMYCTGTSVVGNHYACLMDTVILTFLHNILYMYINIY